MPDSNKLTPEERTKIAEQKVLSVMGDSYLNAPNISKMTGLSARTVRVILTNLIKRHLVETDLDKTKYVYRLKRTLPEEQVRTFEEYVPPKEPYRREVPVIQPRTRMLMLSKAMRLGYNP